MTADSISSGLSRRSLLQIAAAAGLGSVLAGPWQASAAGAVAGYGGLTADPAKRLSLPAGFTYTILAEAGVTRLATGQFSPGLADGAASFVAEGGRTALVVNHEIGRGDPAAAKHPVPPLKEYSYDLGCPGGTTTIMVSRAGAREKEYVSLAGTERNCAGGPSPWGTWLSCEETERKAGVAGLKRDHGYVFEVDPLDPMANLDPQPIKAWGRFRHEAVAIDPIRGRVYLTEDAEFPSGLLYRWTPPVGRLLGRGVLRQLGGAEGTLEAARVRGSFGTVPDLSTVDRTGSKFNLEWVPVPDRDARQLSVRKQFEYRFSFKGKEFAGEGPRATRIHKLEGAWFAEGGVFLVSSFANPAIDGSPAAHSGQIWYLDPIADTLTLLLRLAAPPEAGQSFDGPDNISLCPYGGVVVAEDGKGAQYLWGMSPSGVTYPIARTEAALGKGFSEMAGVNFSPDRQSLFANSFNPGTVFAIRGPWKNQT